MSYRPEQRRQRPPAQAKRYRAGVPKGYVEESSESDEEEEEQLVQQQQQQSQHQKPAVQFAQKDVDTGIKQEAISATDASMDRRLRRLQLAQQQQAQQRSDDGSGLRRRRMEEQDEEESDEDNDNDEEQQARDRLRLKQRALQRVQEEQQQQTTIGSMGLDEEGSEEESEEESSEYETDSEESDQDTLQSMPKPMFVPRNHRATILEQEKKQREAEEREEHLAAELEERKQQSHNMLAEELKRENEKASVEEDVEEDVDDTDGLNEEEEFEAWKVRELMRIKRDREERIAREKEEEELERLRALPEEQRLKEDTKRAEETRNKDKGEFTFMQKYYHKGAFYRDEDDEIFKRDYSAPTINEVRKKDLLPKVMQVKNFGLAGRTKYTHLAAEDTTDKDSPWNQQQHVSKRRKHGFSDRA